MIEISTPANCFSRVTPQVVAVCLSSGGIPKTPVPIARLEEAGFDGDRHFHEKHSRPDRAVSILDAEVLEQLIREGFVLCPGAMGENLTVKGLDVQSLAVGSILSIGDAVLRLEQPRKPCYVLDAIDPRLKEVVVGRCGYMASVLRGGVVAPSMLIHVERDCRLRQFVP